MRSVLAAALVSFALPPVAAAADEPTLARRAFLGVSTEETREGAETSPPRLVVVRAFPKTTAAALGLDAGDVLVELNGAAIPTHASLVQAVGSRKVGDEVTVSFLRAGETKTAKAALLAMPLEESADYETVYGSVDLDGRRLRTILTRPRTEGRLPALLVVQGLGSLSIDAPFEPQWAYRRIADEMTRAGFVTLRVEKPGVGDSEGGPNSAVDFRTETRGFAAGLAWLASREFVDPGRIFLFGHSMGGCMAPVLDATHRFRGHVVHGTTGRTWIEYELDNLRRQGLLDGDSPGVVDVVVREAATFLTKVYGGRELRDALAEHPALARDFRPDLLYGVKEAEFFRQLAATNLAEAWEKVEGDVLALWGDAEFVTGEDDHRAIVEAVNAKRPGHAELRVLPGTDHALRVQASARESFDAMRGRAPRGALSEEFLRVLVEWTAARAKAPSPPK
jgi:dienelactone hydrolase